MNSYQAEIEGRTSLVNAFIASDCKDGITLSEMQIKTEKKVIFWHQKASEEGGKKNTYITFNVIACNESDNLESADNEVAARTFEASIDIFTRLSLHDNSISLLITNLVTELESQGFDVDMGPDFFENDTALYHKVVEISKEIL